MAGIRRPAAALAVILGAAAGCGSSGRTATPTTAAGPATTTSTPTATTPARVQNLPATDTLRTSLLAAFAAFKKGPVSHFSGPQPGTLYYAYRPSDGKYWALAYFTLTPAATYQEQVAMQDGGDIGIFTRASTGDPWQVTGGSYPFPCPGQLPADLVTLWSLQVPADCVIASATSPDHDALTSPPSTYADVGPGTYFGKVLEFDLQLSGSGTVTFYPETWTGSGPPASEMHHYTVLSFEPTATASYSVGSSPQSSHVVTGRFDTTFAGLVKHYMASVNPYFGYVVTVTVPAGCQGSCSQISSITQVGPLTPTPANPDFTEPAT